VRDLVAKNAVIGLAEDASDSELADVPLNTKNTSHFVSKMSRIRSDALCVQVSSPSSLRVLRSHATSLRVLPGKSGVIVAGEVARPGGRLRHGGSVSETTGGERAGRGKGKAEDRRSNYDFLPQRDVLMV
jgi:hypothetical protein